MQMERAMPEDGLDRLLDWNGAPAPLRGHLACTALATPSGWTPVLDLRAGDRVLTFEDGPRQICRLVQTLPSPALPPPCWPLHVPAWALDNRSDLRLLPDQPVLLETDLAEQLYGDPFALVPAEALEGWRGISRCAPLGGEVVVEIWFERPQVVYASRGVLLACPGQDPGPPDPTVPAVPSGLALRGSDTAARAPSRTVAPAGLGRGPVPFPLAQARHLVACLMAEEVGGALRAPSLSQAAAF
jgi:hypothetical protein